MGKAYSYDLRTKVIEALDRGMKKIEASRIFNLSRKLLTFGLKREN
ncbi:MAG: IS630 transposase-related protein [Prochloraceae cyanobacterium]|nr:IS630 transposase-related protein [Prochloraceae cyanobacterium]